MRANQRRIGGLVLAATADNTFEVEGDNYDPISGKLRVAIIPPSPCGDTSTTVYTFRR